MNDWDRRGDADEVLRGAATTRHARVSTGREVLSNAARAARLYGVDMFDALGVVVDTFMRESKAPCACGDSQCVSSGRWVLHTPQGSAAAAPWPRNADEWIMLNDGGVSPDERAGVNAEGLRPSHDMGTGGFCTRCGAAVKGGNLAMKCAAAHAMSTDREKLATQLEGIFDGAPGGMRESFLAIADEVLRRFPAVLQTAGDQAAADEIAALRKALADAEERVASAIEDTREAVRVLRGGTLESARSAATRVMATLAAMTDEAVKDAHVYRDIRVLTGANFGAEGVTQAVERVVNEREAYIYRADTERARADAADKQDGRIRAIVGALYSERTEAAVRRALTVAKNAHDAIVYERDGARKALTMIRDMLDGRAEESAIDAVRRVAKDRDDARSTLAMLRKALGGGVS